MDEKRIGRQEPTVGFTLPYTNSNGEQAIELYEKTGRVAFDWQKGLIEDMLALNDEGLWVHTSFGYSVPRQNGKNEVVSMRELYGLTNGERILHTAHRTSTSRSAWERLTMLLDALGMGEKCADNPTGYTSGKSKGQEFIFLHDDWGGGRIQFRTRTTTGGLGETYDTLIIDEAQEYQDDQASALKYTIVSANNPQTIYLGTPPTPVSSGTRFPDYRKKVLCGERKNSGWAEWSVEEITDPHDVDTWYETNPSLGLKLTERAIDDEIEGDPTDFNIQRLGLWIKYNQQSAISKKDWEAINVETLPSLTGQLGIGVKFNRDGSTSALSIAVKTEDGNTFVETIGCKSMRDGLDWIVSFLVSTNGQYMKVVCDGANGVELLKEAMKDAGLKPPVQPTPKEYIDANSKFEQMLFQKELRHMPQPAVDLIVTNCEKRPIGSSGGFGYKSIRVDADVSILDSIILASWCLETFKAKRKQSISY